MSEKSCHSCLHERKTGAEMPCRACRYHSNWEPEARPVHTGSVPRVIPIEAEPAQTLGGIKNDSDKATRPELLPVEALDEISKVLAFGAKKYAANNWRAGFKWTRTFGALLRHLYAWARGEDNDPETGLSHLAHAGCNVLFLLTFVLTKTGEDDRHKTA